MPILNKLVRDRIIEILEDSGRGFTYRMLEQDEYVTELHTKLDEEVNEYHEAKNTEELIDILEIVIALAKAQGVSEEKLLQLRKKKREEKGGFNQRLYLVEVSEEQ